METASVSVSRVSRGSSKNRSMARVSCPRALRKSNGISADTRFFPSSCIPVTPSDCSMCRRRDIIRIPNEKGAPFAMELVKNKIYRCQITDYTSDGMGFAKIEGRAVFVPRTAVGDQCDVRIVKVTKNVAFGRVERLVVP